MLDISATRLAIVVRKFLISVRQLLTAKTCSMSLVSAQGMYQRLTRLSVTSVTSLVTTINANPAVSMIQM